jgi:diacylglycerol kinase (ATP)
VRAAAIAHSNLDQRIIEPFDDARVNLSRGNTLEPCALPDVALVFGGDGAVHRLLSALANASVPVLVVPAGSANDFARCLGIGSRADALRAWRNFLDRGDNVRAVDLGAVRPVALQEPSESAHSDSSTFAQAGGRIAPPSQPLGPAIMRQRLHHAPQSAESQREIYFSGIAGIGLDAETNRIAARMPGWLRRTVGYPLAALAALARYRAIPVRIESFDRHDRETVIEEPALFASVGNAPEYGSGIRMLPQARVDDGELDLCFVAAMPALRALRHFHRVYAGTHLEMPEVRYLRTRQLFIESAEPSPIYADGEYLCQTPAEISVSPRALRVIVP